MGNELLVTTPPIQTSRQDLLAGDITVEVQGFSIPAFRAAPAGKNNLPVVLVVSEIFGLNDYIADIACRFAQQGYLAIAPALFIRQGDPNSYPDIAQLHAEIISKVPDAQVINDLDACLAWAEANGGNPQRTAITGFCWGGRITWLYAMHQPRLKAGVAWYGRLEGEKSATTPNHPIDLVAGLKAPVLGLYGAADTLIAVPSVERMKTSLADAAAKGNIAAKNSSLVIYPDAPHAFHADYRASYRPAPAQDGWQRTLSWFDRYV